MQYANSSQEIIFNDIESVNSCTDLSSLKNSRVFLAGANGLIGAYFAYLFYFLNERFHYDINVDLITKNKILKGSRIYDLLGAKGFNFIQQDLSECATYPKQYDFIIHAAGYAAPSKFLNDPIRTIDVNYIGLKSILESALKYGPRARILYLSSSEIYGSPTLKNFPTPETYFGNSSVANNRACYIESKRLSEVLALNYNILHNLQVKIVRPALSYGPGMMFGDQRVISQFISKAYHQKAINMIDDGRDLRCFCYLSDVLRQLINILLFAKDTIYNVGSMEEEISIKDLAIMIGELMQAKVDIGPGKNEMAAGAPSKVCLDMRKIETEFGFKPVVKMREGLKKTIDWNLSRISEDCVDDLANGAFFQNNAVEKVKISSDDFQKTFNDVLGEFTKRKIDEYSFEFRRFSKEERDNWILFITKILLSPSIVKAGQHRLNQWEQGWLENFSMLARDKKIEAVVPRYFGKYEAVRWKEDLIKPLRKEFEYNMLAIIQYWLFEKYFKEIPAVYEFGCGTGHNLLRVREVNPAVKIVGLDWTMASLRILSELVKDGIVSNLSGYKFDFFNPDYEITMEQGSGVLTVAALEQIGDRFGAFIEYLIKNKPKICIHIEPIAELLDEKKLLDYLSIEYFKKRNYVSGLLNYLQMLESRGEIIIHQAQRSYIGSLFVDGYSIIIWSPK